MGVVLYGGAFDPPHLGHVAVADGARERFGVERLVVLVSERPAHRAVHESAEDRLALAAAAFPRDDVRLDPYPRTVELLRAESFEDPVFVIGADQFRDFLAWSEPAEVLVRTRIAVATRPGFPRGELDGGPRGARSSGTRPLLRDRAESGGLERHPGPHRRRRAARRAAAGRRRSARRGARPLPSVNRGYTAERKAIQGHEETLNSLEQARRIAALALEKLAEDVVILDMRPECSFTDYFVIATGRNARQTAAIWDEVHTRLKQEERLLPQNVDGPREGAWIVADYLDVVLHVFTPDAREYYRLEELWSDVPAVEVDAAVV